MEVEGEEPNIGGFSLNHVSPDQTPLTSSQTWVHTIIERPVFVGLQITRDRAALPYLQSDQHHCITLIRKYPI